MRGTSDIAELANLLNAHAPYDGEFALRVPGVSVFKISRADTSPSHGVAQPAVCIIAQGAKSVMIGDDIQRYAAGQVAVFSVDVPLAAQVTKAHPAEPYLALKINVDAARITDIAARVFPHGVPQPKDARALHVGDADAHVVDAARRLMELMSRPPDAELIAPLVIEEILIRLLRSPMGSRIAQLGQLNSNLNRVARAVSHIRDNYDRLLDLDELASLVNMSVSTFHRQFKAVTSMSPLQFQKNLRLQEARRLMLTAMLDSGAAARRVGYVSASQFTREYGRVFGSPPAKDIHRLREQGPSAADTTAA
jgi:AraC-like DNA-binding protein